MTVGGCVVGTWTAVFSKERRILVKRKRWDAEARGVGRMI
jgi:hypothetical protein